MEMNFCSSKICPFLPFTSKSICKKEKVENNNLLFFLAPQMGKTVFDLVKGKPKTIWVFLIFIFWMKEYIPLVQAPKNVFDPF